MTTDKPRKIAVALLATALCLIPPRNAHGKDRTDPINIAGPEQRKLNFKRSDGGLAAAAGWTTTVVFRADRDHPEQTDGKGWTYHHHPDIACWNGRLYIGWDSCQKDEDTWPSRELYSTSADGKQWSPPTELFPQGISTPLRMYFFHAPNGRMLALAGLRVSHTKTSEKTKGPLVVREIGADGTLGPIFTLRRPGRSVKHAINNIAFFDSASDPGFVAACRQLLADHVFLEQQDFGKLLSRRQRMKWHHAPSWAGVDELQMHAISFGMAMCFYQRADGALVSVGKQGWVTVSKDGGHTWSQPVVPRSLVTGMGKVWGQRTPDGRYLLAYNPNIEKRYPLAIVTSDDGITFRDMRSLNGDLPPMRYSGSGKVPGASYVRGISAWSSDGSRANDGTWLVYSVNKEEIWVSHLAQ